MTIEAPPEARLHAPLRGMSPVVRNYMATDIEVRRAGDESTIVDFTGHANVSGKGYDMYGGPEKGGWTEFVDRGAAKKTLSEDPDTAFLINHTGMTLARTKAGTLALAEDATGLDTQAQLDTRNTEVNNLTVEMERKSLDEMSFAFRVVKQVWLTTEGDEVPYWDLAGVERHITEYNIHKGDVSVVNYGASPFTDASLRSVDQAMHVLTDGQPVDPMRIRRAIEHLESLVGGPVVSPEVAPSEVHPDLVAAQHRAYALCASTRNL